MALTLRANGQIISSSWFNDFYNLLTGTMTDQPVTIANTLKANSFTHPTGSNSYGFFGTDAVSNVMPLIQVNSSDNDVHVYTGYYNNKLRITQNSGGDVTYFDGAGLHIVGGSAAGSGTELSINTQNVSNPSRIRVGVALGVMNTTGTRLFEVKSNGNAVISGTTYATGGSGFDGFDFAECMDTDQDYPAGTVVCPVAPQKYGLCTHDNCHAAAIISGTPGFMAGSPGNDYLPIALAGKVLVKTAFDIPLRTLVTSDGRGGIRPAKANEWVYALGFVIEPTDKGQCGIIIRNMLARG